MIDPEIEESKVKALLLHNVLKINQTSKIILGLFTRFFLIQIEDEHHFRKPANDITSQLEINFGDLGRPGRGRGGPRGGRGGRGRGSGSAPSAVPGEVTRPVRGGRTDKVDNLMVSCH